MAFLELTGVSKAYGGHVVLEGVELGVERGEFVSIIGHSGCGKSTLLALIAGLERPSGGEIRLEGRPVLGPGPDRCVVFQNYALLPWLSLYENVRVAVDAIHPRLDPRARAGVVEQALRTVGLWEHRRKRPGQVSGGMKQRTALARAFAANPKVLLMDEPFGALDALTRAALQDELLKLWEEEHKTVLMVTHDIDEALLLSDRIVVMTGGPRARVGRILRVDLPRPRDRVGLLAEPRYLRLKEELLDLLGWGRRRAALWGEGR